MLNRTGIKKESYNNVNQILFDTQNWTAVGIIVNQDTQVSANVGSRKIAKAGYPLTGDLRDRSKPFQIAHENDRPVGVLLHDVDVTDGNANGTLLIKGVVDWDKLDSESQTLCGYAYIDGTGNRLLENTNVMFVSGVK